MVTGTYRPIDRLRQLWPLLIYPVMFTIASSWGKSNRGGLARTPSFALLAAMLGSLLLLILLRNSTICADREGVEALFCGLTWRTLRWERVSKATRVHAGKSRIYSRNDPLRTIVTIVERNSRKPAISFSLAISNSAELLALINAASQQYGFELYKSGTVLPTIADIKVGAL